MIRRTRITAATACVTTLLALGAGWFAFGQTAPTNTPAPPSQGMQTPLIRDLNMERKVEELTKRINALEATVERLTKEIVDIKKAAKK
jgi:hypothetical protein